MIFAVKLWVKVVCDSIAILLSLYTLKKSVYVGELIMCFGKVFHYLISEG